MYKDKQYNKPRVQYDAQWFIDFYLSKSDNICCTGKLVQQNKDGSLSWDVIGHLHHSNSSWDLFKRKILFNLAPNCISVWDNKHPKYQQNTPVERIVAYLTDIKAQKESSRLYWENQRMLDNL